MARCSRRRLALGGLTSIWACAMLVLGLRLIFTRPTPEAPGITPVVFLGLSLTMAALGLFTQQVANRLFPARSRRLSDAVEITTGAIFVLSLLTATALHLGS